MSYNVTVHSPIGKWNVCEDVHTYVSPMIAQSIHEIIQADPSTPISTIIAHMKSILGYTVSYRKAWLGK